jgi:hypothetical protein
MTNGVLRYTITLPMCRRYPTRHVARAGSEYSSTVYHDHNQKSCTGFDASCRNISEAAKSQRPMGIAATLTRAEGEEARVGRLLGL